MRDLDLDHDEALAEVLALEFQRAEALSAEQCESAARLSVELADIRARLERAMMKGGECDELA